MRRDEYLKGGKQRDKLKYSFGFGSLDEDEVERLTLILTSTYCDHGKVFIFFSFFFFQMMYLKNKQNIIETEILFLCNGCFTSRINY